MIDRSSINFRIADKSDLDLIVEMRMDFIKEIQQCDDIGHIIKSSEENRNYFLQHFNNSTFIGFLGDYNNQTICCAGLLLYSLPPLIAKINRLQGHVLNFYTIPEYRNMGVGNSLMKFMIQKSREIGIDRLFLNSTKSGERVYKDNGFIEPEEKALILELS